LIVKRGKADKIFMPELSETKKDEISPSNSRVFFIDSYTQVSKFFKGKNNSG